MLFSLILLIFPIYQSRTFSVGRVLNAKVSCLDALFMPIAVKCCLSIPLTVKLGKALAYFSRREER
jgi:hypothetical protein